MSSQQLPIEIRLRRVAEESGYPFELLLLLYQSIPRDDTPILKLVGSARKQLPEILQYLADELQGDSQKQLAACAIRSFDDLARALTTLIDAKIVACADNYFDVLPQKFEYITVFESDAPKLQWKLRHMVGLVTSSAIAMAGYVSFGINGAFIMLFGALLIYFGIETLRIAKNPLTGRANAIGVAMAIVLITAGIITLWSMVTR